MSVQYSQFKQIICTCNYSNSYKMAWAKALVDLSKEQPLEGDKTQLSLELVAKKYFFYYWNQTLFFDFIQSQAIDKKPAVIVIIKSLINKYYSSEKTPSTFDFAKTSIPEQAYQGAIKEIVSILKKDVSYRFLYLDRERLPIYEYQKGVDYILISTSLLEELKDNYALLMRLINYRWGKMLEAWNSTPRASKKVMITEQNLEDEKAIEKYNYWIDCIPNRGASFMSQNKDLAILDELENSFKNNESDSEIATDYADQLFHCFEEQLIDAEQAYKPLVSINTRFPRIERVNGYISKVLTPSSSDTIEELVASMGVLNKSFYSNPKNEVIAESYAIALSLYAEKKQTSEISEPLNKLAELINLFPENELIDEKYNNVLDLQDNPTTIPLQYITPKVKAKKVKKLSEKQAVGYAETLCNLSKEQEDYDDIIGTCNKLEKLCKEYSTNNRIAFFYADALYNMITFVDDEIAETTLHSIELLHQSHEDSEPIAELFVNAIEEAIDFSKEGSYEYLTQIESISHHFDSNQSILDSYAYALYTQIKSKTNHPKNKREAREKLLDLCNQHPDNNDIHAYYSDCC